MHQNILLFEKQQLLPLNIISFNTYIRMLSQIKYGIYKYLSTNLDHQDVKLTHNRTAPNSTEHSGTGHQQHWNQTIGNTGQQKNQCS